MQLISILIVYPFGVRWSDLQIFDVQNEKMISHWSAETVLQGSVDAVAMKKGVVIAGGTNAVAWDVETKQVLFYSTHDSHLSTSPDFLPLPLPLFPPSLPLLFPITFIIALLPNCWPLPLLAPLGHYLVPSSKARNGELHSISSRGMLIFLNLLVVKSIPLYDLSIFPVS